MYIFRLICGCTDRNLKEKLLKLEDPNLADIERIYRVYEIAHTALGKTANNPSFSQKTSFLGFWSSNLKKSSRQAEYKVLHTLGQIP